MSSPHPGRAFSEPVIEVREGCKHFYSGATFADLLRGRLRGSRVEALRSVTLTVGRGEIVALMGANGAGKSTLLRVIAGLLVLDSGEARALGCDLASAPAALRRRVAYVVSDERSFSWRLTGKQNLEFFAALHGLRPRESRARVGRALEIVGLGLAEAARPVREYSSGMRQKLALARGLLGEPEVLLLDEPTRGLDPRSAAALRSFLCQELSARGGTALVATHTLEDARTLAGRLVVLEEGRVIGGGPPAAAAGLLGLAEDEGTAATAEREPLRDPAPGARMGS